MARCWTCGSEKPEFGFTCSVCTQTKEIVKVRESLESMPLAEIKTSVDFSGIDLGFTDLEFTLDDISSSFSSGLSEIAEAISELGSEIASVIEWCCDKLSWKIEQQTGILKSIDETLKTPGQTQAGEWRQIAEGLRNRGVLDESEKFFLKSLETNPLDYRTYIGIGKNYLKKENFVKAREYFEKSLPHAPKGKIVDYKSYSYRLIGRVYFCQEDNQQALSKLKTAIEISPRYAIGHYDYALYCVLTGNEKDCVRSLKIAVDENSNIFKLIERENRFGHFTKDVEVFLRSIGPYKKKIMGENFFGVEEAKKYFNVNPSEEELKTLARIPFPEAVLKELKDTHILVAVFPLSILEIREEVYPELFYDQSWYNEQAFAREIGKVGWQLVRKTAVPKSTSKNWSEQQNLLFKDEEVPSARVMVYTIIGHCLATGKQLFENVLPLGKCLFIDLFVRTSSISSDSVQVCVGRFFFWSGLRIYDPWNNDARVGHLGVSSARKF